MAIRLRGRWQHGTATAPRDATRTSTRRQAAWDRWPSRRSTRYRCTRAVPTLRVPNIMNHVCVAARTDGSREGGRSSYREYEQAARQSEPPLWQQPFGLARVFAHDFAALLGNIRDIACV